MNTDGDGIGTYTLRPLAPGEAVDAPLRAPHSGRAAIYVDHVDPYYNVHCELADDGASPTDGEAWPDYWRRLVAPLAEFATCFAVVALSDGCLAGQVRFLPRSSARLRYGPTHFGERRGEQTLLIGAGTVDLQAAEEGIDVALLQRVVGYAREAGYERVRAIAWSDVRPYAMWGESLPLESYRAAGFTVVESFVSPTRPMFKDLLGGSHGPEVRRLVEQALSRGVTVDQATILHAVELDLSDDAA